MSLLRTYQLDLMLYMSGICGVLTFMTLLTDAFTRRRKSILALMELSAMLLLLFDRASYLYRGGTGELSYLMVRLSNGLVFFLSIFIPHLVTLYLEDLYRNEGGLTSAPRTLKACELLFYAGTVLIVVSQFTGLYYSFDQQNVYHRSAGFPLSYTVPVLIVAMQELTLLHHRTRLNGGLVRSLMLSLAMPTLVSVVQIYCYGVSLTSVTMVFVVIVFYIYSLKDLSKAVQEARHNELETLREAERREAAMFEQIKRHPILGYQILSNIRQSPALSVGAHYHHERYDGTGYPDGLRGEAIPETARIIAVADAYDAMNSTRSYRGQLSPEKTRRELLEGRGKQFDPKYADILLRLLDERRV